MSFVTVEFTTAAAFECGLHVQLQAPSSVHLLPCQSSRRRSFRPGMGCKASRGRTQCVGSSAIAMKEGRELHRCCNFLVGCCCKQGTWTMPVVGT